MNHFAEKFAILSKFRTIYLSGIGIFTSRPPELTTLQASEYIVVYPTRRLRRYAPYHRKERYSAHSHDWKYGMPRPILQNRRNRDAIICAGIVKIFDLLTNLARIPAGIGGLRRLRRPRLRLPRPLNRRSRCQK